MERLQEKLEKKQAQIGIIGLGYVGLPLAVEIIRAGHGVIGVDVDPAKIEGLRAGQSHVTDISNEQVAEMLASGRFEVSTDYGRAGDMDAIVICVPTPLRKTKDPDVSYVLDSVEQLRGYMKPGTLVVLESTVYPGFTEELVAPELAKSGLELGKDLFVAFSPERVDPGNGRYTTRNIPKVVGGVTANCTQLASLLYQGVVENVHPVGSATEAEMAKLLENTFRAVNIALVNEMLLMSDRMGVDIWRVVDAAATKPFGFMPFFPGPGIGGHCIPVDPTYLSWKARSYNFFHRFIELATDINGNMPYFVLSKLMRLLNQRGEHVKGSDILVVGVAYKPNVADTRESPALDVARLLVEAGANVSYHDSWVPTLDLDGEPLQSRDLTAEALDGCRCAVVVTAHANADLHALIEHVPFILDTRNALKGFAAPNVLKL